MGRKKQNDRLPDGLNRKADGRYRIKISQRDPETGKRIYRAKTLPRDAPRAQAIAALNKLRSDLEAELDPALPTLASYAKRWLRRKSRRWKPSTAETYLYRLAHHVLPHLGHLPIDRIGRRQVLAWRAALEGEDEASPKTVAGWWRDGLRLLRDACADYELPDPTDRLDPPAVDGELRRERRTLSAVELGQLAEALHDSRRPSSTWPAIACMAYTGCRRGEALALRWEDVDLPERVAILSRSVYYSSRTGWSAGAPKNGKARVVGLPARLVELLADHRRKLVAEQHPGLELGLVAPAPDGGYCSYRSLRGALSRAAERAGIEQKVTPQVLRRSYNTIALQTMDRLVAQAIMGHADDAMSTHYLGLRPETIRDAADAIWGDE